MHASGVLDDFVPDWAAIAVVVLGITAFAAAQGLTYPLVSLVLESRGVPAGVVGLNAASFASGLAAATLMIGPLTASARGDRLIISGLVGCALALVCFAIFDQVWIWFLARFGLGFSASVIFMVSEAWLNTACPDRLRGRISGIYGAGMSAGFAVGPLAIPFFGTKGGFAFALLAVYVALIAFATSLLSRRARTQPARTSAGRLLRFCCDAPTLIIMALAFGFADIAAISTMPIYFVRVGYSEAFAAFSVTVMALSTALAQLAVGGLLDKLSRPIVARGCGLVAALAFLSIPLLHSQAAIIVVFAVLGAASFALYTCALTLLGESFRGGMLVAGSAALSFAYAVGSAAGSTTTGFSMELFSPVAGPLAAGLFLVVFTALFRFDRR